MTLPQRFHVAIMTAVTSLCVPLAGAQGLQPVQTQPPGMRPRATMRLEAPSGSTAAMMGQSSSSAEVAPAAAPAAPSSAAHSMLDEPAAPAQIQVSGDRLTIHATNASLSEVIRQVARDTGMQVEGNSRDERVFGSYGPGSPPEVLSALLYDSGYNVIMVGSTADGAPRRLVLSPRSAENSTQAAITPVRSNDDEDEEPPAQEAVPIPPPNPAMQVAPGVPAASGQPKTPQQMLEELQRMHQGQQAPELPHD